MSISPVAPTYTPPIAPAGPSARGADHDGDADDRVGRAMRNAAASDEAPPPSQPYALRSETTSSSGHVDVRV